MLIGIIEDDRLLNESLKIALNSAGYKTICAHTKAEALACLGTAEDLLLIDIGLPDGDGISLYRELCERRRVPAVFLTARDEERDMLAAFEEGAEDYVVKPFSVKVLIKRVEAVLRRSRGDRLLTCGDIFLYPDRKQVFLSGREVTLTAKEYCLLEYLMMNQGQVVTKENILENVWGVDGAFVVDNTVSVTINRLRKKLDLKEQDSGYIRNVFGLGYRIGE